MSFTSAKMLRLVFKVSYVVTILLGLWSIGATKKPIGFIVSLVAAALEYVGGMTVCDFFDNIYKLTRYAERIYDRNSEEDY